MFHEHGQWIKSIKKLWIIVQTETLILMVLFFLHKTGETRDNAFSHQLMACTVTSYNIPIKTSDQEGARQRAYMKINRVLKESQEL